MQGVVRSPKEGKVGLDCAAANFLCAAKMSGVDFSQTLMIGRQAYISQTKTIDKIGNIVGVDCQRFKPYESSGFVEWFFELLGAKEVSSLDGCDFEGATYVCDLNHPTPAHLSNRFSTVFDGGTMEHVFNIPQLLKNCMGMVRIGGHYLVLTVANNFMGHGFWQFSPDLFFRILSPDNGYEMKAVLLHEVLPNAPWYIVRDPLEVRRVVELINNTPTYVFAIAKRLALKEILAKPPLQSDYVETWAKKQYTLGRGPWGDWKSDAYSFQSECYRKIEEDNFLSGRF